ncbi:MAG TPA: hypothetical protein VGP43_10020, partial [Chitinophagaceae bacterium]|nr:hypothetical protein [Chitinophagaceae bacterium]
MKKLLLLCIFTVGMLSSIAQTLLQSQYKNLQVLEKDLQLAKTPEQKTDALISLFIYHSLHNEPFNLKATVEYQQQMEIFTHQTKNPELIAKALFSLIRPVRNEEKKKRIDRLYEFAKLHNLNYYKALAKTREAEYYFTYQPDQNKAAQILNEAISLTKDLNDSLRTVIILEAASRYNSMNNHLQALQLAFQANEIASKMKSVFLLRFCNGIFSSIYRDLKIYNKAIDYQLKELELISKLGHPHILALIHAGTASNYFRSDQPMLGNYHVAEAYRLADSVKGSKRLYNQITVPVILAISVSENKAELADFLKKYRQHFFILPGSELDDNLILSFANSKIGNFDSARLFINKAGEYLSDKTSAETRKQYFYVFATIAAHDNDLNSAGENYKKSLQIALTQNDLPESIQHTDSLKSILVKQNNLPEAVHYYKLGDSLQIELTKQLDKEDITKQEVAALEKQKEMEAIEKEKEKNQRYNLQYLGITFGVVALFISLLLMGIFKVSPRVIKILSFFSFLLFFEFIFLIFHKQIEVFT